MYLSRLVLDPRARLVQVDLANPYQLHRTICSAFPQDMPENERVLFRLEAQNYDPTLCVLIQSLTPPDWRPLERRVYLLHPAEVKEVELNPETGDILRFRLLANPTKRIPAAGMGERKKDGKRVGLFREEEQEAWLQRKGEQHGFELLAIQIAHTKQPDGTKVEDGIRHHLSQVAVRFDGILRVTAPELFGAALRAGIGSGKGLGFGLLSLAAVS